MSWWNDFVINIPLAYVIAFPFGLISKNLFLPMMIFSYWITNIVGLILVHHGINDVISKDKGTCTKKDVAKDIIISILYTIVVVILVKMGWLHFPIT